MSCPNCGHNNRDSAKFCKNCGYSLLATPPEEPHPPPPPPDPPPVKSLADEPMQREDPTHYTAEISRRHPACFVFLIDQSASMRDKLAGGERGQSKADGVAQQINRLLAELIAQNSLDAEVLDRMYVSVIGYGANIGPAFRGALANRDLLPISDVAANPASVSQGSYPVWFEPVAHGGTPMGSALCRAIDIVSQWVAEHRTDLDYPPIVMNITDGEADDADQPDDHARRLKQLATGNGRALLFNLHLSDQRASPVLFPDSADNLSARFAEQLFALSSVLPAPMRRLAESEGFNAITEHSRGFVYNADMTALINFIDIGTRPSLGTLR